MVKECCDDVESHNDIWPFGLVRPPMAAERGKLVAWQDTRKALGKPWAGSCMEWLNDVYV